MSQTTYWPVLRHCGLEMVVVYDHQYSSHWKIHDMTWHFWKLFVVKNFCLWSKAHQHVHYPQCICRKMYIKHSDFKFVHCVHVLVLYLDNFLCFLMATTVFFSFFSKSFVWAFSFLFLSVLLWWLGHSPCIAPDEEGGEDGIGLRMGSPTEVSFDFTEFWVFLGTTLTGDSSNLSEILCCSLAWDDWMGQGKTSQSKCMWAGTWAIEWGWETEESEAAKAGMDGGLEAGGQGPWASLVSGWEAVMYICCCYRGQGK